MKQITVKDIVNVTHAKLIIGDENQVCENFTKDTRALHEGDVYIALTGENFDGNVFWKEALLKGASCVIVQNIDFLKEDLSCFRNQTILLVSDTLVAMHKIASFKRCLYHIPVIAITGSVGKTSTKDIVANVVSQKYATLKTQGNHNNHIGLPFTLLNLKNEEAIVLEMGMNHFGEIRILSQIARPDVCIITNIGTSHIGNLGSRENILKAKLEILEGTSNPLVIINNDNDLLHNWYEENKHKYLIKTYGIHQTSDVMAHDIELNEESSKFVTTFKNNEEITVQVPVSGEHFILNSMCAILVGKALNLDKNQIKNGIQSFELTKKRMDISTLPNGTKIINDAYNASLESMSASLKTLGEYKNRKIAVLGDMFELGKYSESLHKEVGKQVFDNGIDILICHGENAKFFAEAALRKGMPEENVYYIENRIDIIPLLQKINKPNDVILFKASNSMKFFELVVDLLENKSGH